MWSIGAVPTGRTGTTPPWRRQTSWSGTGQELAAGPRALRVEATHGSRCRAGDAGRRDGLRDAERLATSKRDGLEGLHERREVVGRVQGRVPDEPQVEGAAVEELERPGR